MMADLQPLLLNDADTGGAAQATKRIHAGLQAIGVDSSLLVRRKNTDDSTVLEPRTRPSRAFSLIRPLIDRAPLRFYPREGVFSLNWLPDLLDRRVARIDPDVVHLNWVAGGFMSVGTLAEFGRPVVWRLPDMWAFTGGCHYSDGCTRYRNSCGCCPKLASRRSWDLTRLTLARKRRALADVDVTVVAPSTWLAEEAAQSRLFEDQRIEVIPNGLDTRVFRPVSPEVGRAVFGLPPKRPLVLFGAVNPLHTSRKGADLFAEAMSTLADGHTTEFEIVVFGTSEPADPPEFGAPVHYTGYLHDEQSLALLYAAVDVMVVPSRYEGFGQTVTEAMASGTPVVAFDATGPADTIIHRESGYLAEPYKVDDLADGIAWVLEDEARRGRLSEQARSRAVEKYHFTDVAQRYLDLYREIV